MGLAYDLTDPYGVLAIMLWAEDAVQRIMQQMVNQGAAITQAYSLSLGGPDAATGSILFGAIDTDKYEGDLISLDSPAILTEGRVNAPRGTGVYMWAVAGAEYWSEIDTATVPCSMKDSEGSFIFGLGGLAGPKVVVLMRNLVSTLSGFGDTCAFLVKNQTNPEHYHLGVPLLQSFYAVFDLPNSKFAVATPKLDSMTSNIVRFAGNAAPIPSTVSVLDQLNTVITESATVSEMPTATKSFSAAAGFQSSRSEVLPLPTSTSTNPAGESDISPETRLTKGATIGIGVGVGAPVFQKYPAEMDAYPGTYELPAEGLPVETNASPL
ncbi:hypothetical protein DL768_006046 [Monosporascus sp. mg162]|nr:hypothetical protein DL768_006046 [Monosporascus sp. mg162]